MITIIIACIIVSCKLLIWKTKVVRWEGQREREREGQRERERERGGHRERDRERERESKRQG